jgi:hypothetical protein
MKGPFKSTRGFHGRGIRNHITAGLPTRVTLAPGVHVITSADPLAQTIRDTLADNELPDGTLPKDHERH